MKTEIIEFKDAEIYCPVENGTIYVAIKPICEALGVDANGQNQRIKRDEILSQLRVQVHATGRDSKQYKMDCLPLKYTFGWIFTIDENQVKEEAREKLIEYKHECYEVLYDHFWNNAKAIKRKEEMLMASESRIAELEQSRKRSAKELKAEKARFKEIAITPVNQMHLFDELES